MIRRDAGGIPRFFALAPLLAGLSLPAQAATIVVDTLEDRLAEQLGGLCSLRQAIETARSDAPVPLSTCVTGDGDDTIVFDVTGTIALTEGSLPALDGGHGNLSIVGPGPGALVIDGGMDQHLFTVSGGEFSLSGVGLTGGSGGNGGQFGGALWVASSGLATVDNVEIFGNTAQTGGGIANGGTLVLTNSILRDNTATGTTLGGGGLYNSGTLTLDNTTITGNTTAASGGGIYAAGDLVVTNSVIADNVATGAGDLVDTGAGIHAQGDVTVSGSRIEGNQIIDNSPPFVQRIAGGIFGSRVTLVDSVIAGNTASTGSNLGGTGSAVFAMVSVNISGSTISDNLSADAATRIGGVLNIASVDDTVSILVNSTVSGNQARAGAGIYYVGGGQGELLVTNSTVAGNRSTDSLGEVAGIRTSGSNVVLANSIIYDNDTDCVMPGSGTIVSNGHNLDGDGSCNLNGPGDLPNTDPLLGPLADNGGPTPTHALLAGSPAIDAGNDLVCPELDQRGNPRPQDGDGDGGAVCDIGAYELHPPDLQIVDLVATADAVAVGGEVVITAVVRNAGRDPVDAVVLTIELPAALGFVSASPGCAENAGIVSCDLGTLAAQADAEIEVTASALTPGDAGIEASVIGDVTEANTANNNSEGLTLTVSAASGGGGNGGGGGALSLVAVLGLGLFVAVRRRMA